VQKVKPALLRGFDQEYLPQDQLQFNRLIDIARRNFERYGFLRPPAQPIRHVGGRARPRPPVKGRPADAA